MRMQVFSIYDTASAMYQRPFYCRGSGEATRAFCDLVGDVTHPLGMHPEDYSLHFIGYFDDGKGIHESDSAGDHACVMTGLEAVAQNRSNALIREDKEDAEISNGA